MESMTESRKLLSTDQKRHDDQQEHQANSEANRSVKRINDGEDCGSRKKGRFASSMASYSGPQPIITSGAKCVFTSNKRGLR